ncbi:MAG: putative Calcium/calmodulin-dependent protein kinase type 1 [Streblomastix strix]|uniref:Putative Calcium/calmodulin-dependent protein kinase type 1 n=1 Tax=Streblomastix strix TaxID=222440 RepID=A0A5J4X6X5_9EUKA|nr:MAG: putative Calcium/calmodulin-dependent protein kinase type 1 [Streblomastix strix]
MSKQLPKLIDGVPSNLTEVYQILEELGEGNFAKVRKAKCIATGQLVAIKFIDKIRVIKDPRQLGALFNEINIMKNLNHPHIVHLYEVYETDDHLCLIMELMTGGELFERIAALGSYSERDASLIMRSLFGSIKYLHQRGIAHRDLKPENVLYESKNSIAAVKISDFGMSKVMDEDVMFQTCCGSPHYVAPEVLENKGYGPEVDLWSLGVMMYVLLCGFPPFFDENNATLFRKIKKGQFAFISPFWNSISVSAKDLISRLLLVDPKQRLSAEQALKHPWFTETLSQIKLSSAVEKMNDHKGKHQFKSAGLAVLMSVKSKKSFQ